jgi:hypothetical protein
MAVAVAAGFGAVAAACCCVSWTSITCPNHSGAVLKMRKLIPCYLQGFQTARQLQGQLFAAQSLADWHAAAADPEAWGFDPAEPYPLQALRKARLKGAGQVHGGAQQKVVLPQGWLEEGDDDEDVVPECLDEASCEG